MTLRSGRTLGVLLAAAALAAAPARAATTLTLLHVNDTHSRLLAWGPKDASLDGTLGGLAKAAAVIAAERAAEPEALLLHAGDLFNGDLFFDEYLGVPELLTLRGLGLDAMAVGNHELQFGPVFLAGVLGAAWPEADGVPLLGANLDLSGYPPLQAFVRPTFTKAVHGVTVGFFGLSTPYDSLQQPYPVVIDPDLVARAADAVAALRAQGAQVVVCLAHLGMELSSAVAAQVGGIDVVVNGHDHALVAEPVAVARPGGGETLVVSAGDFYRAVGRLRLSWDGARVALLDYALLPVGADVAPLPPVEATFELLRLGIAARYGDVFHTVLATAAAPLTEARGPSRRGRDSAIGNLLTDAYRAATGTDVAIEAGGFIEDGLLAGPIVGADLFHVMPYGFPEVDEAGLRVRPFRLATFGLTGADLVRGLEIGLVSGDMFLEVSGMRFEYDSRLPPGQRVIARSVHVGGRRLDPDRTYRVTANEGALYFMPQLGILPQDPEVLTETAWSAASAFVSALGVVEPVVQNRIRDVAATGR